MNKKIKVFCISIFTASLIIALVAYICFARYRASVTEAAFSLCAQTINSEHETQKKSEEVNNYLTFVEIPDKTKQLLVQAVKSDYPGIKAISEQMEFFEYSADNLRELCKAIEELDISLNVFNITKDMSSEELAELLVEALFGKATNFRTEIGDGREFIKRYYCSNVCIDACENGIVRYMNDFNDLTGEDPFMKWLKKGRTIEILDSYEYMGIEYREIASKGFTGKLSINRNNDHVFAAEITIYSFAE